MSRDFTVGDWRVQPSLNRLQRGEEVVRLEPKVMQVLVCLAEQAGEVVTRDTLISRVWPDVFVTDDVLHRAIRELRRVFGDSSAAPRTIETIRKRGYRLMVVPETERVEPARVNARESRPAGWSMTGLAAALALASVIVVVGLFERKGGVTEAHPRFVPLASGPANESDPAIAPDGQRFAYVVADSTSQQFDLYLSRPGGSVERLTDTAADERVPAWSADGRRLAFVRASGGRCDIMIRQLDDATERRVADCLSRHEPRMAWTADGAALIVSSADNGPHAASRLMRVPLAGGTPFALTVPPAGALGDHSPAVSPDGRSVAFIRQSTGMSADVYVVPIAGGSARRLTFDQSDLTGVDWMARGRALVFSSDRAGGYSLWRIPSEGGRPQLVAGGAARLKHPTAARAIERVAYESWNYEINIWRMKQGDQGENAVIATSELWNLYPQISPDGTRLAYVSTQSGSHELWVASGDGSNRRQLTDFGSEVGAAASGTGVRAPRWSPDSRRLVFAAQRHGRVDLYMADVESNTLTALTADDLIEAAPSWAADGNRLYYSVRGGDESNIFVRDAAAGAPPAIAIRGGVAAQTGADGALYFTRADEPGLWRQASMASPAVRVTDAVPTGDALGWFTAPDGLYFVNATGRDVVLYRAASSGGAAEAVMTLPQYSWPGFSIGGDGSVYYARWGRRESNIMAVDSR